MYGLILFLKYTAVLMGKKFLPHLKITTGSHGIKRSSIIYFKIICNWRLDITEKKKKLDLMRRRDMVNYGWLYFELSNSNRKDRPPVIFFSSQPAFHYSQS